MLPILPDDELITVHVLRAGRPLCRFSDKLFPADWPAGHHWTGIDDIQHVTCKVCRRRVVAENRFDDDMPSSPITSNEAMKKIQELLGEISDPIERNGLFIAIVDYANARVTEATVAIAKGIAGSTVAPRSDPPPRSRLERWSE